VDHDVTTPVLGTLEAHEEVVRLAERRVRRAAERRQAIEAEHAQAEQALTDARQARADWVAASPDPQILMF
jgi:hypothetical protein